MIKPLVLALAMTFATTAMATDLSCGAAASEKKLAGAAKTSFDKKCIQDAAGESKPSS